MVTGIHHMSFTVSDMDTSIAFYRDVLGLELIFDNAESGQLMQGPEVDNITACPNSKLRVAFVRIDGKLIELVQYNPPGKLLMDSKANDIGSAHVCFKTDDINGLYEKLEKAGAGIHCPPQDLGSEKVFYFRDPDGNILEVVEGDMPV